MTTKQTKPSRREGSVRIGGEDIVYPQAALMAVEADRLGCSPLQVKRQPLPDRLPKRVEISGHKVDIVTAAVIAEEAARYNATPEWVVSRILEAHARKRGKGKKRSLPEASKVPHA